MKHTHRAPSVTSLPAAPKDEANQRVRRYMITMGIRTGCFLLMALVQPYGWWTWAFAAGAIFLPYIAVIDANAGDRGARTRAESPTPALDAGPAAPPAQPQDATPGVITLHEKRDDTRDDAAPDDTTEGER